jgi:atypical dual specificity phosphatase
MLRRLVAVSLYWPTFAYNVFLGRFLKVRHWWDSVDEHCILGAVPLSGDPQSLKDMGVTGVVNMCEEYSGPKSDYQRLGIEQLWLPTTDFQHPSREMVEQGAEFIQRHKQQGGKVYVHCKAGRARSATVVLWWLVRFGGLTPVDAQQKLLKARPHVHARVYQRPVIQELNSQYQAPNAL